MGVSTNFYTVLGIKTEWLDDFAEAYDEVYDDPDTPFVLMDSMDGDYMIFGTVLFDSGDARWGFEDGDSFTEIDISTFAHREEKYKAEFSSKFPEFTHLMDVPFNLMSLAHYS